MYPFKIYVKRGNRRSFLQEMEELDEIIQIDLVANCY